MAAHGSNEHETHEATGSNAETGNYVFMFIPDLYTILLVKIRGVLI